VKERLFWVLWGFDALICAIVLVFFFLGTAKGWVSSFNIGIWVAILAALAVVVCGSLWLKTLGYSILGVILLLVLAVPGLLFGLFIVLFSVSNTSWN